jgi:hypothetical protein
MSTREPNNILIAVPAFGGQVHFKCAESLRLLDRKPMDLGIAHTFRYSAQESLVTRARNWFANLALFGADEEGAAFSHLLFIDADLAFNAKDIVAMIQADKPIGALPYALKAIDWQKGHPSSQERSDRGAATLFALQPSDCNV